jgi:hypothetical protein
MAISKCRWKSPEDWSEWSDYVATGLHARNRWRLPVIMVGMLFADGRRTVTTWLRAAGVADDFQSFYYFLSAVGRNTNLVATRLLTLIVRLLPLDDRVLLVIDDSPTKRYGPKVEGADVHHNPTPGPADQPFLYGHVWVTISLAVRHPNWGAIGLPLQAMLYVRKKTMTAIPKERHWRRFATKLQLAARLVEWAAPILKNAGKTVWVVIDGGYTKRPFLQRVLRIPQVVIVGRLRKDAALRDLPPKVDKRRRSRGRPRKYGKNKISLAKRAGQKRGWKTIDGVLYNKTCVKKYKTFLATYRPVGGVIRVVLVKEAHGWFAFFCTDPSADVREILETFSDRSTIEQDFHDVKEIWGAGQQQLRNIWSNIAAYNLNLWMYTLVELWAWTRPREQLCDRSDSPWDDATRRPSHADRRKSLRREIIRNEFSDVARIWRLPQKIIDLTRNLMALST